MHNNPVKAGIVDKAEEYLLRSVRDSLLLSGIPKK